MLVRQRILINAAVIFLAIFWCFLHIWRKLFAYIEFMGIYITEWILLLTLLLFFIYAFLRSRILNIFSYSDYFSSSMKLTLIFVIYGSLIAILNININPIAFIPIAYLAYLPIFYIVFKESDKWVKEKFLRLTILFYILIPLLFHGVRGYLLYDFTSSLPGLDDAGWTFTYGVALTTSLVLITNRFYRYIAFFVCLLGAIALFQRGAIFCFIISYALVFMADRSPRKYISLFVEIFILILTTILAVILVSNILTTFSAIELRFDLNPYSFGQFILSIFINDVDISGTGTGNSLSTRTHRIEMWLDIINYNFRSLGSFLFGNGFSGEVGDVLGISFRVPHNGFITVFYRTGIIGLIIFIALLISLITKFFRYTPNDNFSNSARIFGLTLIGSFLGDCFTGTILDSPFTLFVFLCNLSLTMAFLNRRNLTERSN